MIKNFFLSLCLLFVLLSNAQESTSSPYSFYGFGDTRFKGTADTRAMAGLSVLADSIHVNLQNPALLSTLKLTNYAVGGTYGTTKLETETQKENARRTTFDYLAVAFPATKNLGVSLSLMPFSSVGYKVKNVETNGDEITETQYEGIGGINRVAFGLGYKLFSNFSFGVDFQYNFGKIETTSTVKQNIELGTRERNASTAAGVSFNTGFGYQTKIDKKYTLSTALTYAPESKLTLNNTRNIATVRFNNIGDEIIDDVEIDVNNTKLTIPSKISFGAAFGEIRKWNIGAEIIYQNSSKLSNRFDDIDNVQYENATKYLIGGYYIPKFNSFSSYLSKVTYRAGLRYENTGLVIQNKSIKDQGFTLGLGLPVGGAFSNINVGLEYGIRGTIYKGLIRENYANIVIGMSFNDRWFRKAKIE